MTLILTVNGRETIWLLADRRLSYANRPPKDDARKVMILETTDGLAILGYAGLGATTLGTEPADWMNTVLRGLNLPLEQSLGVLADAMQRQLPKHLARIPEPRLRAHIVFITSFVDNEVRLYSIDLALGPDRKSHQFHYKRHFIQNSDGVTARAPRFAMAGTGGEFLHNDTQWNRSLLDLVNANDHGRISANAVADHLAKLNHEVHSSVAQKPVGPNCVVAWRHRKKGLHKGGGGHQCYVGTMRDRNLCSVPIMTRGRDLQALVSVFVPDALEMLERLKAGEPPKEPNTDEINEKLSRLPDKPDENLY